MNRENLVQKLQNRSATTWDVIVIGGGATGLGVAVDASSRGYNTLLLEQSDFAKGTSSRSTKLVHGGVRYLAQGDVVLVMEALQERGRMLANAPHLTFNQEFVIPIYSWWDALMYTVGLTLYDLLAGRLSLGRSQFIGRKKTMSRLPLLKAKNLKGGVVYHDGQFDDARLAFVLAQTCVDKGGLVLNYFRVIALLKDEQGRVAGVKAQDLESGMDYSLHAKLVVNASGVFTDDIRRMDQPAAKPTIRPSQGVHIVLDKSFLKSNSALMIPKTDDGRVLFAIPWYDKLIFGTTDTPVDTNSLEPIALKEEIDFILRTAGRYLDKPPAREDILCIFAGLRPLAANPDNPSSTKEISRRHKITLSPSGLLTIEGGKWTIYRRMAQDTMDRAIQAKLLENRPCITKNMKLSGANAEPHSNRLHIYGTYAKEIQKLIADKPELGKLMCDRLPYTWAEISWICRNEMPRTLEDMLARRTRSLILDVKASIEAAPAMASFMAKEMNLDEGWQQQQLSAFNQLVKNYL